MMTTVKGFKPMQRFHVSYLQLGSACAVQTQRLDRLAWPAMGGSTLETSEIQKNAVGIMLPQKNYRKIYPKQGFNAINTGEHI